MNFSDVLKAMNEASAFELFRLRAAINVVLDEPVRMLAIQNRLQPGQAVEYFDAQANAKRHGTIVELRRKRAVIIDRGDGKRWLTDYASINLDGAEVQIQQTTQRGLGRNEIAVGEFVGCLDRNRRQRSGKVLRLNDKTATLAVGDQQWRVDYGFLHRVLEADIVEAAARVVLEHEVGRG